MTARKIYRILGASAAMSAHRPRWPPMTQGRCCNRPRNEMGFIIHLKMYVNLIKWFHRILLPINQVNAVGNQKPVQLLTILLKILKRSQKWSKNSNMTYQTFKLQSAQIHLITRIWMERNNKVKILFKQVWTIQLTNLTLMSSVLQEN